jgi:hypothetical protein
MARCSATEYWSVAMGPLSNHVVPFSGTRLNDDLLGVAGAGYFTVPIDLYTPIP